MIKIYKGNNLIVKRQILNQDDQIVDLTGARITFSVKLDEGEGDVIIKKISTQSDDITIDSMESSICIIKIKAVDTYDLTPKIYKFELLIELPDGNGGYTRHTAVVDDFIIEDNLISYEPE